MNHPYTCQIRKNVSMFTSNMDLIELIMANFLLLKGCKIITEPPDGTEN